MIMRADEAIPKPLSGPPLQSSPGIAFPWSPLQRLKVATLANEARNTSQVNLSLAREKLSPAKMERGERNSIPVSKGFLFGLSVSSE